MFESASTPFLIIQALGASSSLIAFFTFAWSNIRLDARLEHATEAASKQLAYHELLLKNRLSSAVTPLNEIQAKTKHSFATEQTESYRRKQIEWITWEKRTDALALQRNALLRVKWPQSLTVAQKLEWSYHKITSWYFLLLSLVLLFFLTRSLMFGPHTMRIGLLQAQGIVYIFASLFLTRHHNIYGERLGFPPKPPPPTWTDLN